MDTVTLLSADGPSFVVSRKVTDMCQTLKNMLSDIPDLTEVPVANVKGNILDKLVVWSTYHLENPIPEVSEADKYRTDNISEWDQKFMADLSMVDLFDLVLAANYLDHRVLLETCCKTIANMIKGSTPEEVKTKFLIPSPKDATAVEAQ